MGDIGNQVRAAEPFLKWAGGKRKLLEQIKPLLPKPSDGGTYFEPFLGGGAVFFGGGFEKAVLSDVNDQLIETYSEVRDDVTGVIKALKKLECDEETYYAVRASTPRTPRTRAARFIYLNKNCFNGLYRVNSKGQFNVPFGRHGKRHVVCDEDQLLRASNALAGVTIKHLDFDTVLRSAKRGDLIYLDPPYITSHSQNGFIEYNAKVFAWRDQTRLASVARELVQRGVQVAISNANHASIRELYKPDLFTTKILHRPSTMAASAEKRFKTTELLIVGKGSSNRRKM